MRRNILTVLSAALVCGLSAGCSFEEMQRGMERAGQALESAAEKAADTVMVAGDKAADGIEAAGKGLQMTGQVASTFNPAVGGAFSAAGGALVWLASMFKKWRRAKLVQSNPDKYGTRAGIDRADLTPTATIADRGARKAA